MPGNESWIVALFDEQAGSPAQNVGSEHRFHGVEYVRVENQLIKLCQLEVSLVADHMPRHASAMALEILDTTAHRGCFCRCQCRDGKDIAQGFILGNLISFEHIFQSSSLLGPLFSHC